MYKIVLTLGIFAMMSGNISANEEDLIKFEDSKVKQICVDKWDANGDGEISIGEVSDLTTLDGAFRFYGNITSFNEFKYFTSIKKIERTEFCSCAMLEKITLPESIEEIDYGAFKQCRSLKNIVLPQSLKTMGQYCFNMCDALEAIAIPDKVEFIPDEAFSDCPSIKDIKFGSAVKTLGLDAFMGCKSLEKVVFGSAVETIGQWAFSGCTSLKEVVIPASVKNIQNGAFSWINVEKVKLYSTTGDIDCADSGLINENISLYVPEGTKAMYEAHEYFGKAKEIIEFLPEVTGIDNAAADSKTAVIYSVSGKKLDKMQHGVNIVKYSDGTLKKVMVK